MTTTENPTTINDITDPLERASARLQYMAETARKRADNQKPGRYKRTLERQATLLEREVAAVDRAWFALLVR